MDNPSRDGWESELFAEQATTQLKKLGELLAAGALIVEDQVAPLIADDFICGDLRPASLRTVFTDGSITVNRSVPTSVDATGQKMHHKANGFVQALRKLTMPFRESGEITSTFKIVRVTPTSDGIKTRQFVEISVETSDGIIEQHATWEIEWTGQIAPRMKRFFVTSFEQASGRGERGRLFVDSTSSVLDANPCYRQQFLRGFDHWLSRIQDSRYYFEFGNPGLAIGDVNGDGLDDLYVCQEEGLPNRLFLQRRDGTAEDVSAAWKINWLQGSRGALLVDFDNDGDQDLAVAITGGVALASNENNSAFELRSILPTAENTMSLSAVDYDQDGDLDLYACVYYANRLAKKAGNAGLPVASHGFVYHDANNGGRNSLFRSDGSDGKAWAFEDVTPLVGMDVSNRRFSFAAAWEDFDNDGDQDLYVANDYGRNNLYRNDQTEDGNCHFTDVADSAGAEDAANGMSAAWGDYDRDGWMDVYIANMFSAAGNRVSHQPQFRPVTSAETKRQLRRFTKGNTLLQNQGDETFRDQAEPMGVEMGRWGWGSVFVDLNNDGWEDLFAANGYITGEESGGDL